MVRSCKCISSCSLPRGGCDSILEYFVERREFPRAPLLRTLLFWQALSLGFGEVLKLLLAHRLGHLSGSAFERRLRFFAAFRCERSTGGHLLFLGFCWHT